MAIPAITNNSPAAGYIAWAGFTIQLYGVAYSVPPASSNQRWIWWEFKNGAPIINAGPDVPATLTDDDLVLFANKNGIGVRVQSTSFVDGELLVDGSIFADALSTNLINSQHIVTAGLDAGVVKFGEMSGDRIAANTLAGDRIIANTVTASKLAAGSVTTDKLSSLIGILGTLLVGDGSGRTITLDPVNGINVVDALGASVFQVPTSLLSDISMTADVVARSLTALGVVAMRNPINELSPGAGFYIRKGTTPPRSPLTVTMANPKVESLMLNWQSVSGSGEYWNGLYYSVANNSPSEGVGTLNGGMCLVSYAHRTTGAMTVVKDIPNVDPAKDYGGRIFRLKSTTQAAGAGAWGFTYVRQATSTTQQLRMRILDENFNNLATPKDFQVTEMTNAYLAAWRSAYFSIAQDEFYIDMWITPPPGTAGPLICYKYDWNSGAGVPNGTTPSFSSTTVFKNVIAGKFDFGGVNHRIIAIHEAGFNVMDSTTSHVRVPAEEFPRAAGSDNVAGLFWDSGNGQFYSYDYNRMFYKHSKYTWTDPQKDTLRVSSAWETTSPAGATTEGPISQFAAKKRQYINVSIPPKPTGVTQARVFVGYGTADGGRATHFDNGAYTGASTQIETPVFTGANPVAVATIADSTPAFLSVDALDANGQPTVNINGDGSGRMGPYAWDASGKDFSPFCSVSSTTVTAIPTGVFTRQSTLAPDANGGDPLGMWDSQFNAIAIPKSGWYRVGANAAFESGAGTSPRRIMMIDTYIGSAPAFNVAATQIVRVEQGVPAGTVFPSLAASKPVYLVAGTRVRLMLYQNSGGNLSTRFDTPMSLSVEWIRT